MEETKETIEELGLEAPDMVESMRSEDDHIDIGNPTPEQVKKGANTFINSATESLEIELPNGLKLSLSSGVVNVNELSGLAVWLIEQLNGNKKSNKNGEGYVG